MTAIDEAREALELVVKWERREVAWDTPRARDLNTVAAALRGLIEAAERLSVPPSDDDREDLVGEVRRGLRFDFGMKADDARHAADAIAPRLAGFRRQGPITDARPWRPEDGDTRCQVCGRRNPVWWANNDDWNALMPDDGILCPSCYHSRWLEAAERARSTVPCVECSGTGWLADYQRDGSATADSCRDCGGSGLRAVPSTTEQESDR